ncbi:hypothetical protein E4U31_003041, partial [Claviceps sp. LM219 group G6]
MKRERGNEDARRVFSEKGQQRELEAAPQQESGLKMHRQHSTLDRLRGSLLSEAHHGIKESVSS